MIMKTLPVRPHHTEVLTSPAIENTITLTATAQTAPLHTQAHTNQNTEMEEAPVVPPRRG